MDIAKDESKRRLNAAGFVQVKIYTDPETFALFKSKCAFDEVSLSSRITRLMADENSGGGKARPPAYAVGTRGQRRAAVRKAIKLLEAVLAAETRYYERIPANLHGSCNYEAAEETISAIEEALDLLSEAY